MRLQDRRCRPHDEQSAGLESAGLTEKPSPSGPQERVQLEEGVENVW